MRLSRSLASRGVATVALAAALVAGSGGIVAADSESGQHGHYLFIDDPSHPGATCKYTGSSAPYKLTSFVVRPPKVWWSDHDSNNDHEHGRVGWRAFVQAIANPDVGSWTTVYKSHIQKATAYEDPPPALYGDGTKAPFTKRHISWNANGNKTYRIVVRAFWYRPNGTILGSATHTVLNYLQMWVGGPTIGPYCSNRIV